MKRFTLILLLITGLVLFVLSNQDEKQIVKTEDYSSFISDRLSALAMAFENDLAFWQAKLSHQPTSVTYKSKVAGLLSKRFRMDGNIADLQESDRLLKSCLNTKLGLAGIYQALSSNAITQHKFKMAREYAQEALRIGENKDVSHFLLFDANLELGEYEFAKAYLNQQQNKSTFDYLTRAAKLADIAGDLDTAIDLMERAQKRVTDNRKLYIWSLSNLGDMYGHAGKIQKSYQTYLKVLNLDASHLHSLQGIAWIAFSYDKNTTASKEILEFIKTKKSTPDILLALADIAEFEGDQRIAEWYRVSFYEQASQPEYAGMYNKYLIELLAESPDKPELALMMAKEEVQLRPNPLAYNLLAWSYLNLGENDQALKIVQDHVENQSFEPDVIYHLAKIYEVNGEHRTARKYYKESLESGFELGPLVINEVRAALKH